MRAWVADRVRGRLWWPRAPLLLVLLWILGGYFGDPQHSSIFAGLTLAFHEMGHAAFSWLGSRILTTAGGTIAAGAWVLKVMEAEGRLENR